MLDLNIMGIMGEGGNHTRSWIKLPVHGAPRKCTTHRLPLCPQQGGVELRLYQLHVFSREPPDPVEQCLPCPLSLLHDYVFIAQAVGFQQPANAVVEQLESDGVEVGVALREFLQMDHQ